MKREMSVNGSFYPKDREEVHRYFEHFSKVYDETPYVTNNIAKAIIVPHAGYVYSGFTANIAYRILMKSNIKKFIVIGPSHRVAFNGVSICTSTSYATPFGEIKSCKSLSEKLIENFSLNYYEDAHHEHSTEVQFPFIKHYLPDAQIVELVYSSVEPAYISKIIDFVLSQEDCGVIISTDLSHFYSLDKAKKLDNICLNAINELDLKLLHSGCEACGMIGVEGMMMSAKKNGYKHELLDYRTSADFSNDDTRVVGYMSGYFYG